MAMVRLAATVTVVTRNEPGARGGGDTRGCAGGDKDAKMGGDGEGKVGGNERTGGGGDGAESAGAEDIDGGRETVEDELEWLAVEEPVWLGGRCMRTRQQG
eukprot:581838-Prymnesium_polylepis.3